MEVLAHPDPFVLEHELLERVGRAQSTDALAPVLILVPSRRLADHVQRRLGEHFGARLGVRVLQYRGLAHAILDESGDGPRALSERLEEALLRRVLDRRSHDPWSTLVERRPGTLPALVGTLRDLREAGLSPSEVSTGLDGGRRDRALAAIYADYVARLDDLAPHGRTDEAGFIAAATRRAMAYASRQRFRAVLHHGAYELTGVHLELLRGIDRAATVTFLLPAEPGADATIYAERFARRHLLDGGNLVRLDDRPGGLLGGRIRFLHDEDAAPGPLDGGEVTFANAQGSHGELKLATSRALGRVDHGGTGREIAVVGRSLGPFAAAIESLVRGDGVPATTSVRGALRRDPSVHDLLVLLRVLAEDFPRRATVEVLRSPRVRWSALGVRQPPGDRAEAWSREARLLRGIEGWTRDLPVRVGTPRIRPGVSDEKRAARIAEAARRREDAEAMGRALERLVERVAPGRSGRWSAHADTVEWIVRELLSDPRDGEPAARRGLREILDDMRDLEMLPGGDREVTFSEMTQWIEHAVDAAELALDDGDAGGIRILDAMQARGLTFDDVAVVGLNERVFPRVAREDPFLRDAARVRLAEATGRPLPVKDESDDEERLLLGLVLASARTSLSVSWQRADDEGKSRTPSLALREIARLVHGVADLDRVLDEAERVPAHPEAWLSTLAVDPGLLRPADERLLRALRCASPGAVLDALGDDAGPLATGLRMLRATESFAPSPEAREWDGRVGEVGEVPSFSVDALESLGGCPQQFFFNRVLRVRELDDEVNPWDIDRGETGIVFHRALELLWGRLEDSLPADDADALVARARELLPAAWAEATRELGGRLERSLPSFWACMEPAWRESLERFVDEDVARLADSGATALRAERPFEGEIPLGEGVRVPVFLRFDRIVEGPDGATVGDYKTGNLSGLGDVTKMLKAARLQVPLYWLAEGEKAAVEVLGVGPAHDPRATEPADRRVVFDGFDEPRHRAGFLESLRVLMSLVARGDFPLHDNHRCRFCAYVQACRKNHPPTLEREEYARDSVEFRLVTRKNKSKLPTLDEVRRKEGLE